MSFFSKTTDQDVWKEKYLNLLDDQEQAEKSYKEKEDLLCKIIARLTIAATGQDPLVDSHLLSIREQLKNGINNPAELKDELDKLTHSVAQIQSAPPPNRSTGTESLFDILLRQYTTEKQQNALNLLKKRRECRSSCRDIKRRNQPSVINRYTASYRPRERHQAY
jgi:hypothetical protein